MGRKFLVACAGFGLVAASILANSAVPVAARATTAATAPVGPYNPVMTDRENVRQLYYSVHEGSGGVPTGWTGNSSTCNEGTVSSAFLEATRARINYFRAMAGVSSNETFDPTLNAKAQKAALMESVNSNLGLSHDPPPSWACWTQAGHDGAATSNLAEGNTGPDAIDQLMFDDTALGHRRNMLDPAIATMGSGSVPDNAGGPAIEANVVLTTPVTPRPTPRDTYVAWPPKGFVPYQVVYPRWSFALAGANFSAATVTMTKNGVSIPTSIQTRDATYAGPTITWNPNGINDTTPWPQPTADDVYSVTVANIGGVAPSSYTYNVTVFDPAVGDPSHTQPVITGPASAPSGQNTAYSFNAVPNAIGYKWRSTQLTPTVTDGAEGGAGNFNAQTNGSYNVVQSSRVATGNNAFHLTLFSSSGGDFSDQLLTRKNAVVVNANSQLQFKSETRNFDGLIAGVDVSPDDGATWSSVYQQISAGSEGTFSNKVVSLGAFAGKTIKIRFSLTYNCCDSVFTSSDDLGWFFDDVAFTNTKEAASPVVSNVAPNTTSFQFNPANHNATYQLDVQPQFFGSGAGDWGPAKQVTSPK